MDIAAAEEEIARWKLAAEQEAAAGRAVEQEFLAQGLGLVWRSTGFDLTVRGVDLHRGFRATSSIGIKAKIPSRIAVPIAD
ncbi:putative Paramyosin [Cinnamomum micranthum f. kanehirae]|uniref:Putative Paramyosin n=1 Tax=Cinnamomum micranthum f. kanehirae TaxID=337451 RepID=A0A443Q206_9MAGN|nr:putative Paramyosin [Cinnamomum micranthum f. kanehirae]